MKSFVTAAAVFAAMVAGLAAPLQAQSLAAPYKSAVRYDAMGREVRLLTDSEYLPGYHQIRWNGLDQGGREVSSGLYFIQITTSSSKRTLKAMLLR